MNDGNQFLFLDFDGVLHPVGSSGAVFSRLPLLEELLRGECKACQVIISSSWREYQSLEQLRGYFAEDLRSRVVGTTPLDGDKWLHASWGAQADLYPREMQIRHYLAQRGLNECRWVALDDVAGWFREGARHPNLVLCDSSVGLTTVEIIKVRNMLA
jgi:hypothetical protein